MPTVNFDGREIAIYCKETAPVVFRADQFTRWKFDAQENKDKMESETISQGLTERAGTSDALHPGGQREKEQS